MDITEPRQPRNSPTAVACGDRDRWAWAVPAATYMIVAAIMIITAAVSYQHEYHLARRNGQAPWVCTFLPFTVDGMILAASIVILWANSQGIRRPRRPLAVLVVGIVATIAANLFSDLRVAGLGPAVAASSGVALILLSDVAMWLTSTRRKLAAGEPAQPAAGCSCPPPPVTLAEVLPLARAELQQRGEKNGELELADRFGTTRYKVRSALGEPDAASLNGSGS